MKLDICKNCENFIPHYTYSKILNISKIHCGHCTLHKRKSANCQSFKELINKNEDEISILNLILGYEKKFNKLICEIGDLSLALFVLRKDIEQIFNDKTK